MEYTNDDRMYRQIISELIEAADRGGTVFSPVRFRIGETAYRDIAEGRIRRVMRIAEPALSELFLKYLTECDRIDCYLDNAEDETLRNDRDAFACRMRDAEWCKENLPQLTALIIETCDLYDAAVSEMLERTEEMYEPICAELLAGKRFVKVTAVSADSGDVHNHGRAAAIITTDAGRIVYKPHPIGIDLFARKLTEQFFPDVMKTPKVCARETYGFTEFIASRPADNEETAERYFYHLGGFAAVIQMLGSSDLHHTNVLSQGEYPVIIDYELMMTPGRGFTKESRGKDLQYSLLYSSLMPARHGDIEASILFANDEENPGAPVVGGIRKTVTDYPDAFLAGFREIYHRCLDRKVDLKAFIRASDSVVVRHLLRGTSVYAVLMEKLFSPAWLRDPGRREALAEQLRYAMDRSGLNQADAVIEAEADALLCGDIPYFSLHSDSRDLFAEGKVVFRDYFRSTCIDHIADRIDHMSEADLCFEEQLIRKAMTRVIRRIPRDAEVREAVTEPQSLSKTALLLHAEAIFTSIARDVLRTPCGGLCWFAPDYYFESGMRLMDEGLMNGTMGLAVFFAAVHAVSENETVKVQSKDLLDQILAAEMRHMEELRPAKVIYPNVESSSLSVGLAGKLQASVLIGRTMGREYTQELTEEMVSLLLRSDLRYETCDVYGGLAGLLLVLCRYEELSELPGVLRLCEQIAEQIMTASGFPYNDLHLWKTMPAEWPVSGAGHGQSGTASALFCAGKRLNRQDLCRAAEDGFRFERRIYSDQLGAWPDLRTAKHSTSYMTGYCSGAPGIGLNVLHAGYAQGSYLVEQAIRSVHKEPLLYKDHLCCGNSASIEFLLEAGRILNRPDLKDEAVTRMAMVIRRTEKDGYYHCVNRSLTNVFSPSLFHGEAGIGYEMLRLAAPEKIESLLL